MFIPGHIFHVEQFLDRNFVGYLDNRQKFDNLIALIDNKTSCYWLYILNSHYWNLGNDSADIKWLI